MSVGKANELAPVRPGQREEIAPPAGEQILPFAFVRSHVARKFNEAVGRLTTNAYRGPMAKLGGAPGKVAQVIADALEAKRPRARYAITASADLMIAKRRITPDRVWDLMMRSQFPTPRT